MKVEQYSLKNLSWFNRLKYSEGKCSILSYIGNAILKGKSPDTQHIEAKEEKIPISKNLMKCTLY